MTTRITASWYPPTARGTLVQLDGILRPTWHLGGLLAPMDGVGGFSTQVSLDRPTHFRVSAEGHVPLTFTVTPEMTEVRISEGSRMLPHPASFEASFAYATQGSSMSNPYIPPRSMAYVRPSGFPLGATVATIPMNEHTPASEAVRFYQRLLLGVGFATGATGADGILGINTARSIEAFARWYNGLPEGPPPPTTDLMAGQHLTRGPLIAVDRALTPEKQTALQRFNARASDQLSSLQVQQTVIEHPVARDTSFPWANFLTAIAAGTALIVVVAYADSHQKRTRAATA